MELNNQQALLEFRLALKRMLTSEDGKKVLERLNIMYAEPSALGETAELTYYKLGQKELIQSLIRESERDEQEIKDLTSFRGDE